MSGVAPHARASRSSIRAALVLLIVLGAAGWLAASSAGPPLEMVMPTIPPRCPGVSAEADSLAGGALPVGATPFDVDLPGVANLQPDLLAALQAAAREAARYGVAVEVNSGWRSEEYQALLLCQAVRRYGSQSEAERWVATPSTSLHVHGAAVDVGPDLAADWLWDHGAQFGLCRVYWNEPWHFELRTDASSEGCPQMYADAAHDPRLRE